MNFPPYPFSCFQKVNESVFYAFTSISQQKAIQKLVIFTPTESDIYNLALIDLLDSGELSDTTVSNNQDTEQVLATVIQILLHFLRDKPTVSVLFKGSTSARTRLYRAVIGKYITEITRLCVVKGITSDNRLEWFRPNQIYTAFVVSLL